MPRLNHNEVADAVAEDHICPGCDRDRMDCDCFSNLYPEDLYHLDDPDFDMEPNDVTDQYLHEDLSYLDMEWSKPVSPYEGL